MEMLAEMKQEAGSRGQGALPGPSNVLRCTLPNGITVLARENWSAPSVVIEGYLLAGSLDEPEEMMGLATFTASMLSRGTQQRSFAEINEIVEGVGASIGFSADYHTTSFSAKLLAEDLALILDILADQLRHPVFPAEHVEKVRGQRLTAIAERENDTRLMAALALRELMFGDHPLGRDPLGTRQSNAAVTRTALMEFYQMYYCPQGMVVVVVGAVPAEEAVVRVGEAFADWTGQRPERPLLPPVTWPQEVRRTHVAMPDKSQSDLVLGWPAMPRSDPDFDAARLANTVLGVFGMMGRLGISVRERQGLAYYAFSRLQANRDVGIWLATAGVNPSAVDQVLSSILAEVERLCVELVPADELEDSKRYLIGSLPLRLETNDGVASILADIEWHGLGLDYLERYASLLTALTAEDVLRVAQKYLHSNAYALAVAGPELKGVS